MFTPDSSLVLPTGPVTAYFLSGEWFPSDRRSRSELPPEPTGPRFRDSPIVRSTIVPPASAADFREIISAVESYGGDPARCFYPRHGLSFAGEGPSADVLICFQCHSLYFFENEQRKLYALTERTMQRLGVLFSQFGPIITQHTFP